MSDVIQIFTTTPDQEMAMKIAGHLLDQRLAACVQVSGPIRSVYRWQGTVESAEEWVCAVKTRKDRFSSVEQAIRNVHSYDVPEIVCTELDGSDEYLQWLREQVD